LLVLGRLFVIVKPKLLKLLCFAIIWGWFVNMRSALLAPFRCLAAKFANWKQTKSMNENQVNEPGDDDAGSSTVSLRLPHHPLLSTVAAIARSESISVTEVDCTPSGRHANFCDRLSLRMTDDRQNGDQNVSDGVQIEGDQPQTIAFGSSVVFSPASSWSQIRRCSKFAGDGFNAPHFYSTQASSIIALDFDEDAIPHVKRYNSAPNVTYVLQDIRKGLPTGPFDNIVWDAAIEHFTEAEIAEIMGQLVERLGPDGILSGYTLTEAADGKKSNALHEYEFKDKEDLRRFFTPHFKHVKVWDTIYPTRHNLYLAASQSEIAPFA
jgi:Methyltransferase domain